MTSILTQSAPKSCTSAKDLYESLPVSGNVHTWQEALAVVTAAGVPVICMPSAPKNIPPVWHLSGVLFTVPPVGPGTGHAAEILRQFAEITVPGCHFAAAFAAMFA